jgi:hypothetical protein
VNRATPTRSNRRIAGVEALRATTAGCTARRAGSERIWVPFEDRALVAVGLVSYSLFLWNEPLYAGLPTRESPSRGGAGSC